MKIIELLNAQPVIQEMMNQKMPSKLAYALGKNFRLISQDLEDYDKARIKILQDNWSLNPTTNKYDIPDDDQEKWKKLHNELLEAEAGYTPYKIDLSLTESVQMTPGAFTSLWFIFDEEPLKQKAEL